MAGTHDPRRVSRRDAVRTGLGALLAAGPTASLASASVAPGWMSRWFPQPATPRFPSDPILHLDTLGPSELIDGVPFAPRWFGDSFAKDALPFHACEGCDAYPDPTASVEIAVVGGGISGLACAYLLRDRQVALFDLRDRMGGSAMGERFGHASWSMASAYFMLADPGTRLDALYKELGLDRSWRQDLGGFGFEYDGDVGHALLGPDDGLKMRAALGEYQRALAAFAGDDYPEIPFDRRPSDVVADLDTRTFQEDLLMRCGVLPPRLAFILQAYCYSSFGVGFDELSAAAGWNFVAAEEFGRNVMPGGNAGLAQALWAEAQRADGGGASRVSMHGRSMVTRIDRAGDGAIVRWKTRDGSLRSTFARHVVMANAKHVVRHMMPWIDTVDPEKHEAMRQVPTTPYIVANVLLNRPLARDFYDLYVGGGTGFPLDANAFEEHRVITDAVNAGFTQPEASRALTLYWPLPWHTARFTIVDPTDWKAYAELAVPQLKQKLGYFGVGPADIVQVRMARWGHAMPFAVPGVITSGIPQLLRRPIDGCIWFANQDNWLLPAVETCLEEAFWTTDGIRDALGA